MAKTPTQILEEQCNAKGLTLPGLSRRTFLTGAAGAVLAPCAFAQNPKAASLPIDPYFWSRPRELWLKRLSNAEEVRVVYFQDGKYLTDPYVRLCELLRDVTESAAVQMDMTLLNVLTGVQGYYKAYGLNEPILITSGYRTASHNAQLRGEGAARNSMHLYGKAADITLPGIPVWHLGRVRQYLQAGGVGFYPTRHFVHVDTGSLRSWSG